jgi:hypothetical protein
MQSWVQAAVPVIYVRDVDTSEAFYARFGYSRQQSGDTDARWSYLQCGVHTLLLACVQPPLIDVELPLLIYLYVTDLPHLREQLERAGYPYEMVGYPDHAPGGELRVRDPDGHVVLVGQRTAMTPQEHAAPVNAQARHSLIKQAAEAVSRRGGSPATCQVGTPNGDACTEPAEIKLADSWGVTAWSCLIHADEALIDAPGAFIATENAQGLQPWLSRRSRPQ